jgi:hypothetical protein
MAMKFEEAMEAESINSDDYLGCVYSPDVVDALRDEHRAIEKKIRADIQMKTSSYNLWKSKHEQYKDFSSWRCHQRSLLALLNILNLAKELGYWSKTKKEEDFHSAIIIEMENIDEDTPARYIDKKV